MESISGVVSILTCVDSVESAAMEQLERMRSQNQVEYAENGWSEIEDTLSSMVDSDLAQCRQVITSGNVSVLLGMGWTQ